MAIINSLNCINVLNYQNEVKSIITSVMCQCYFLVPEILITLFVTFSVFFSVFFHFSVFQVFFFLDLEC